MFASQVTSLGLEHLLCSLLHALTMLKLQACSLAQQNLRSAA